MEECYNCKNEIPQGNWQKVINSLGTYCIDCYEIAKLHEGINYPIIRLRQ